MPPFHLHQRYTSEAEPELGIGIVTELPKGRVKIHFPSADETRLYAADTAPLRRVRFKPGDRISDREGRMIVVEEMEEEEGLIRYKGQGKVISEAALGDLRVQHGAMDRLLLGEVDSPALFALRRRTLQHEHARRLSPVNGFAGGRIDLIPHQLYIAHEVSARYAPRVLLSDEVGLGKTIEACLIVHRLLSQGRMARVLILVPDSLVHQWFVELLRRFNLWFHIFDEERCAAAEAGAPEGNPFLDSQLILCSTAFLAQSPLRAVQACRAQWDLLVVDEAHHLEWSPEQASPAYEVVAALSQASQGLLLLTATPEQLGLQSHFARLRLLDPERYFDFESFKNETLHHQAVAALAGKLAGGETLDKQEAQLLESKVGPERWAQFRKDDPSARESMIQELVDRHGPGRVIFRNRRASIQGFPARKLLLAPLTVAEEQSEWQERMLAEFRADLGLQAHEFHFENDPRLEWLLALLQRLRPAKVLLICNRKEKVLKLKEALSQRVKTKVGVFHEDLSLVQRDRQAAWFSEPDGARLLLCSEIGSEGRNFQFAHHLILFDLPLQPELLEQRIGRLDRIGQQKDISIHVPYLKGSAQERLARWYHEGLDAFEHNLEGGRQMEARFGERLRILAMTATEAEAAQADALIAETKAHHGELKSALAAGRDRLLEMNSFHPAIASALIEQIRGEDLDPQLEQYMLSVFEQFGIEVEDLAPRTYLLHPQQGNAMAFPALPDEGMGITFDRLRGLSREEMGFLTWDHPMVTGAIDMVLGSGMGSASFGRIKGGGTAGLLLEAIFVLETAGAMGKGVDRFLPHTPLRVVVDHSGTEVTTQFSVDLLDANLRPGQIDELLGIEAVTETLLPAMLEAATQLAEQMAAAEMAKALKRMQHMLDPEIERLQALQRINAQVRATEIELAQAERAMLASRIAEARIRLDAVMLIQRSA